MGPWGAVPLNHSPPYAEGLGQMLLQHTAVHLQANCLSALTAATA
jgi:hypothetical protein